MAAPVDAGLTDAVGSSVTSLARPSLPKDGPDRLQAEAELPFEPILGHEVGAHMTDPVWWPIGR